MKQIWQGVISHGGAEWFLGKEGVSSINKPFSHWGLSQDMSRDISQDCKIPAIIHFISLQVVLKSQIPLCCLYLNPMKLEQMESPQVYNYHILTQSKLTTGSEIAIYTSSLRKFNLGRSLEDLNVSFICCHLVKRELSTLWIKFVWLNSSQVWINPVKLLCNHKFFISHLSSEKKFPASSIWTHIVNIRNTIGLHVECITFILYLSINSCWIS